jgi:hypothetical protein
LQRRFELHLMDGFHCEVLYGVLHFFNGSFNYLDTLLSFLTDINDVDKRICRNVQFLEELRGLCRVLVIAVPLSIHQIELCSALVIAGLHPF